MYNSYINRIYPKTPILLQTENTPIINLLADPFKKTLLYGIIIISLFIILTNCNIIKINLLNILLIFVFLTYIHISQIEINNLVINNLRYLPRNAKINDYNKIKKNNNIITILLSIIILFLIIKYIIILFTETLINI